MKIKFKSVLALFLAVLMAVITPLQVFASTEAENYLKNTAPETLEKELENKTIGSHPGITDLYVSDIKIATGKTVDECKKALHDEGYMVYDCDLNEGTEPPKRNISLYGDYKAISDYHVPKRYTYLGYKVTTNSQKAITNLHIMDENGGYKPFSYKDFAAGKLPGLQNMIQGMKATCAEMKKQLDAGSYAAKVAKEYLDMFCVPEKSSGTTGVKLGDYLLDPKRTNDEFRDLQLVLDTLMLNTINSMLAMGITDSEICLKTANGGENEDGDIAATYTSRNGITGYTALTENGDWLKNAAAAMTENKEFANVSKTDDSEFFAEEIATYGAQIAALRRAFDKNTLSDAAIEYLMSEKLESTGGAIGNVLGTYSTTAYDLLQNGSDRMLCLFLAELPEVCTARRFIDALEICATDCQHRLPVDYTYDRQYDIDWVPAVVDAVNAEILKPSDKSEYDKYNTDIEYFIDLFNLFIPDYEKAIEEYKINPDKPILDDKKNTLEKADKIVADALKNQTEVDPASYINYVAIRDYFSKYTVYNGKKYVTLLDYFIESTKNADATDVKVKARIYPIVKTLSTAKKYSYQSLGVFTFLLYSVLGTDEIADVEAKLTKSRLSLEEAFESKNFSIWFNSNKDLIERENDSGVAMTSQNVIDNLNKETYANAFPKQLTVTESYKQSLTYIGYTAMGAVAGGLIAYAVVKGAMWAGGITALGNLTALFASASGIVAFIGCVAMAIAAVTLAVVAIVAIVFAILLLIKYLTPEAPTYSQIPDIMLDCVVDGWGYTTAVCRYDVVKDVNGKPADLNAFVARKWNALYYTKDPAAGSPLTLGKNGEFFSASKGTNAGPDNSNVLTKFRNISGYNLNFHCYYDHKNGIYLHYFTKDSLKGKTTQDVGEKKYIDAIAIAHSKSDDGTQAYLLKESGYQVLSVNLSPNANYNTYLAFHTTSDPTSAITDIRVAYGTAADKIRYGGSEYSNIIIDEELRKIPQVTCEGEEAYSRQTNTAFSYSVYTTKSRLAGDPLLASGFNYVSNLVQVPEDADVVSYFGGMPMDFNTYDRQGNAQVAQTKSGTQTKEIKHTYDIHRYVYYKSERDEKVDYTSKIYLAGLAFFSGSEDLYTDAETNENTMAKYAMGSYGSILLGENLTPGLYNNNEDVTYLGYVCTRNPKKALTEISVFTGEPKSSVLPQNINVAKDGYCSCEVFTQGDYWYYGKGEGYWHRLIRSSHTYFTNVSTEIWDYYWPEKVAVLPRALYTCGPKEDVDPIELQDVVFSTTSNLAPTNSRDKGCYNLQRLTTSGPSKALENEYLGYNWHSVHAIDQYYYDTYDENGELQTSYDLGLGMSPDAESLKGTDYYGSGSLYIYYRNGTGPRTRKKYVANVALCGSVKENSAYNDARIDALSVGEDIVNISAPITTNGEVYNELASERAVVYKMKLKNLRKTYNDNCYLLAVTYTDDPKLAVGSVRIVEQPKKSKQLEDSLVLPQYDPNIRVTTFSKKATALTGGEMGTEQIVIHDASGNETENYMGTTYSAYVTYTAHDGTPINRVDIRYVGMTAGRQNSTVSAFAENGAAEYYVQLNDTMEPFMINNDGIGTAACFCLQRSFDESEGNTDKYIMSLKVVEDVSYDGNMILPAARLGASGCPYIIDFDIAEGTLSYGSNKVVTLGVERTSDPSLAIKDIRLSPDDLGTPYIYNNMRYDRVNDKPLYLKGADKNGVYIYTTDGSDSLMVAWHEIPDKENIDWMNFDWEHLDHAKSSAKDPTFFTQLTEVLGKYPSELRDYVNKICSDDYTSAANTMRLKWSEESAITNIGYAPDIECPEQVLRKAYGRKTKNIYWAGCSSYGNDNLPVPVTNSTQIFTLCGFDDTESASGLRVTTAGNVPYRQYQTPAERARAELNASVFTEKSIVMISVLSGVFVIGLAAVFIIYRKKKKSAKRSK